MFYTTESYAGDGSYTSPLAESTCDSLMESSEIKESTNIMESVFNFLATAERNERIAECYTSNQQIKFMRESGQDLYLTEGVGEGLKNMFTKGKKFLEGIWKKIQEVFKSFIIYVDKATMNGREFWKKYEKDIMTTVNTKSASLHKKEIKFYPYPVFYSDNMSSIAVKIADCCADEGTTIVNVEKTAEELANALGTEYNFKDGDTTRGTGTLSFEKEMKETFTDEKITEALDSVRKEVVLAAGGSSNSLISSSEFKKELADVLRGDEDTKELDTAFNAISPNFILRSDRLKSDLDKAMKASKKSIDEAIKVLEKLERVATKNSVSKSGDDKGKKDQAYYSGKLAFICNRVIKLEEGAKTILLQSNATMLETAKGAVSQAKSIYTQILGYRNKKESFDEGAIGGFGAGFPELNYD